MNDLFTHPPKVKYSVSKLLFLLVLFACMYVLAFQDEKPSNNNSFTTEYFTLGGCAGPGRPIHTYKQREQAKITALRQNISL